MLSGFPDLVLRHLLRDPSIANPISQKTSLGTLPEWAWCCFLMNALGRPAAQPRTVATSNLRRSHLSFSFFSFQLSLVLFSLLYKSSCRTSNRVINMSSLIKRTRRQLPPITREEAEAKEAGYNQSRHYPPVVALIAKRYLRVKSCGKSM